MTPAPPGRNLGDLTLKLNSRGGINTKITNKYYPPAIWLVALLLAPSLAAPAHALAPVALPQKVLFFHSPPSLLLSSLHSGCMSFSLVRNSAFTLALRPVVLTAAVAAAPLPPLYHARLAPVARRPFHVSSVAPAKKKAMPPKKKNVEEKKVILGRPGNNLKVSRRHWQATVLVQRHGTSHRRSKLFFSHRRPFFC